MTTGQRTRRRADRPRIGVDVRCLADEHPRGFARYTLELIHALTRRPELELVAIADTPVSVGLPIPVQYYGGGREFVREQIAFVRAAARERLDALLVPTNRGLPWATGCATVLTLHDVVEWDPDLVTPPRGKSRIRFGYASVLSLAGADLIITVSRASAKRISQRLSVPEHRLRVVHEAASERFESDPGADAVERLCHQLGVRAGFVLYVGGFDKKKDIPTLLRAFARLLERGHATTLVIAGAVTAERTGLERLAADLDIARSVCWTGFVDDGALPALYRAAGCFVFPAIAEGFGLPVVEAMACGTPVIAARAASLPEVVSCGGVLFRPGDDAELAELLQEMLEASETDRQVLSDRARKRAAQFSWDRTAEATTRVLYEAMAMPPSVRWYRRVAELTRWRHRLPPSNRPDSPTPAVS